MTDARRDEEAEQAAWDFRIEQERETFRIYEQRRVGVELEATAITAAALTIAALLVATHGELSDLSELPGWGLTLAVLGLLWAIAWASVARFASWRLRWAWLHPPTGQYDQKVKKSLKVLRAADESTDPVELRRRAMDYWSNRARSAWKLGDFKWRLLKCGLWGLLLPFLYLFAVGVCLAL